MTSATQDAVGLFDRLAAGAAAESPLWAACLRASAEPEPVFSALCDEQYALGVETIYEGYLVHYGRPRLFAPPDADTALLLGDYLYAHGLVHIAATGNVAAVYDLAELISLCAQARAAEADGDGAVWAASAALLGVGGLEEARRALREGGDATKLEALAREAAGADTVALALAAHDQRVR